MIDLTPLDVRKKRGDFRKVLRGYDPDEVDTFLEVVAERLEALVKEKLTLEERTERLQEQVASQEGREEAVHEALVTAQELRREMREQAHREAESLRREAEAEIERVLGEARRRLKERREALQELERMRLRFLKSFRTLVERQLDSLEVEEERSPLDDTPLEIDFTVGELQRTLPELGESPAEGDAPAGGEGEPAEKAKNGGTGAPASERTDTGGGESGEVENPRLQFSPVAGEEDEEPAEGDDAR